MRYVSALGDDCFVHGTYNASHGFQADLLECGMGYHGVATTPVKCLHDVWNDFFEKASRDALLLHLCHSQGAIHTRNALLTYPPEWRERIIVVAIAPAAYIDKELCYQVTHYRAEFSRDFIPYLDRKGAEANRDTIVTLKSHQDAPLHDHSWLSPTYKTILEREINDYHGMTIR